MMAGRSYRLCLHAATWVGKDDATVRLPAGNELLDLDNEAFETLERCYGSWSDGLSTPWRDGARR